MLSCESLPQVGSPIHISTYLSYNIDTRASYSGDIDNNIERIDWEVGDIILISQEYNGNVTESQYRITSFIDDNRRSKAQIEPVGTPLMYQGEGTYIYRGYYPGDKNGLLNGDTYSFSVSSSQSNDVRNDLFMIVFNYSVEAQRVKLEFRPVVDAYEFILPGTVSKIQLESLTHNLSGDFTIQNGNISLAGNGKTITIDNVETNTKVRLFTLPQEIQSSDMQLKVYHNKGIKAYGLGNNAYPKFGVYQKFNFPAIDTPITSTKVVNGIVLAEAHRLGYNWQLGGEGNSDIYWNNPDNNNNWEPIPYEKLWEIIENLEDINLSNTWEITEITPEDINVFPKVKTVNISAGNLASIDINNPNITELNIDSQSIHTIKVEGCNSLKTFNIKSQNNIKDVVVKDNLILEYFTMNGPAGAGVNIYCENCPVLEWFSLTGGEGWNFPFHKEIINCPNFDHYNVPGCKEY